MRRQALIPLVVGALLACCCWAAPALADPYPGSGDCSSSGQDYGSQYDPGSPGDPSSAGDSTSSDPACGGSDPGSGGSDQGSPDPSGSGDSGTPSALPAPALPTGPLTPSLPVSPAPPAPPKSTAKPTRHHKHAILDAAVLSGPTIPGTSALVLSSGLAVPPAAAPRSVKELIWTANRLIGLPYRYGGGHGSFADNAYDCSGSVSYALHAAGLISYPEDSTSLETWGSKGAGRWVTVYTNSGHAWMIVAGIRLDTSSVGDPAGLDGPRWRPALRPTRSFKVRHPLGW